jgi:hypothetical protein
MRPSNAFVRPSVTPSGASFHRDDPATRIPLYCAGGSQQSARVGLRAMEDTGMVMNACAPQILRPADLEPLLDRR